MTSAWSGSSLVKAREIEVGRLSPCEDCDSPGEYGVYWRADDSTEPGFRQVCRQHLENAADHALTAAGGTLVTVEHEVLAVPAQIARAA